MVNKKKSQVLTTFKNCYTEYENNMFNIAGN